jgi:hypothetical protein
MKLGDHCRTETLKDTAGNFLHSGLVFTCPVPCGMKLSSWNYQKDRNWRKACALHVKEKHGEYLEGCGLMQDEIDRLHEASTRRKGQAGGCSS